MKNVALIFGRAWKNGFGLGVRVHGSWKCVKGLIVHVDFANIELIFGVQYMGICKCGEAKSETK